MYWLKLVARLSRLFSRLQSGAGSISNTEQHPTRSPAFDTLAFDRLKHRSHRLRRPVAVCELQCQSRVLRLVPTPGLAVACANEAIQECPMRKSLQLLAR